MLLEISPPVLEGPIWVPLLCCWSSFPLGRPGGSQRGSSEAQFEFWTPGQADTSNVGRTQGWRISVLLSLLFSAFWIKCKIIKNLALNIIPDNVDFFKDCAVILITVLLVCFYFVDARYLKLCILFRVLGQLVVCTLCSCVMKTKQIWLFSAHMLPLLARLCLVPLETIVIINKFAMIFTGLEVLYFLGSNLLVPYNLAKSAYRELVQVSHHRYIKFCDSLLHVFLWS